MDSLRLLEQRLQYRFRNGELLKLALTHSSAESVRPLSQGDKTLGYKNLGDKSLLVRVSNEKLEFLGDRVLGLVVAAILYERNPQAVEGELSRRLMALVREEQLAKIGRDLELSKVLILGGGAELNGIQHQNRALADAVEAIIAAIYLDAGIDAAKQFINSELGGGYRQSRHRRTEPKIILAGIESGAQTRPAQVPCRAGRRQ